MGYKPTLVGGRGLSIFWGFVKGYYLDIYLITIFLFKGDTIVISMVHVLLHVPFLIMSRLRASEERQFCPWKNVAIQITKISNPMQGMNFQYGTNALQDDFSNAFPGSDFPSPAVLTPPLTGRGKKGKSRSKKTVPNLMIGKRSASTPRPRVLKIVWM